MNKVVSQILRTVEKKKAFFVRNVVFLITIGYKTNDNGSAKNVNSELLYEVAL